MDTEALQSWLQSHVEDIVMLADYEPYWDEDEDVHDHLDDWFGSPAWRDSGYAFSSLGIDGTGSLILAWHDPDVAGNDAPVVMFSSEGETFVLARDSATWAELLVHSPVLDALDVSEGGELLVDEDYEGEETDEARARYRQALEQQLGDLKDDPDELLSGRVALDTTFRSWTQRVLDGGQEEE